MTISFRPATATDVPAVDRIFRDTFCETFAHLYRREDLDAFLSKFTTDAWLAEVADPAFAFRIAEAGGEPVGYVKLGPLTLPAEPKGKPFELKQFYLLKPWHGSGAAAQLMDWALEEARDRGAEELYLSVYTDNHRAKRFYERYGFVEYGPYAFMVGEQADEDVIMKLEL